MNKIRALVKLAFANKFYIATNCGEYLVVNWGGLKVRDAEAIAKHAQELANDAINEHRAVAEVKKIIAGND